MPSRLAKLTMTLLAAVLCMVMALAGTAVAAECEPRSSDFGEPAGEIESEREGDDRHDDGLSGRLPSASEHQRPARDRGKARLELTAAHALAVFRPPE
jgi:hypothetical protein